MEVVRRGMDLDWCGRRIAAGTVVFAGDSCSAKSTVYVYWLMIPCVALFLYSRLLFSFRYYICPLFKGPVAHYIFAF